MPNEKNYFRFIFSFLSIVTVGIILWNTYFFFNQLKDNERNKMEIWASAFEELLQEENLENNLSQLPLNVIKSNTTTPMILYSYGEENTLDTDWTLKYDIRNIDEEKVKTEEQTQALIEKFKNQYTPIDVSYKGEIFSTIYYGNSSIINKLKYYPAAIMLIILLFVALVYFFFKTRKASEQNKLWAGMAKETAHQIGTPLSSLIGWTEILRSEHLNPEYISEIEKDIFRLQTITDRFSKVGSMPDLTKKDVVAETIKSFDYLKARSSKLIEFELQIPDDPIYVSLNKQLYSWAIENLVKNAIDAMKGKGKIIIRLEKNTKFVHILVSDTGKGIPKGDFNKIFKPGFTTKKRGWGLGLSLTRRIIEDYHQGKIKVKQSEIGTGTIFQISLKLLE
ncbi:MAG: two-component sensor histidine kinase [Flavobacteriaceae bacterium CG_4_8_14_3_um_filter_34_10]|nr:HAMP domain-containing histidine kinase [Flavobacteriia bacterium]OIP51268.1 MAG: two-component sensor histidine kinase [Flavobacteriaceae bacterium CG2_30_34_30]PIQ18673.1 MAG: two-component sensor histidine kinase [Flavobacteriaceae bacterium CG18_big_fil_WC_8_21_14_2_50_34_36]PIV48777.1 MAG: two-component sensor histidine kinase [Flavobacteriaceae bacterium CG02_land_8_20_14_3_00_34_13]PIX09412.1 MAG: two-component sensor histidine kinase [Flavobacteriaceae bacterium CG_4_8_14_3_um_filter